MIARDVVVHPTACIDEPCTIGTGTRVWHFAHVMAGARIGERCMLGHSVFVGGAAVLGNGVRVQNHVSIYDGVVIEDDVFIGPSAVFTNVKNPRAERRGEVLGTRVLRGATIGANATIVCGATIGRYAFVGAGAVVTHDVPDFALVTGAPARRVGWVDRAGERLSFAEARSTCGRYLLADDRCLALDGEPS